MYPNQKCHDRTAQLWHEKREYLIGVGKTDEERNGKSKYETLLEQRKLLTIFKAPYPPIIPPVVVPPVVIPPVVVPPVDPINWTKYPDVATRTETGTLTAATVSGEAFWSISNVASDLSISKNQTFSPPYRITYSVDMTYYNGVKVLNSTEKFGFLIGVANQTVAAGSASTAVIQRPHITNVGTGISAGLWGWVEWGPAIIFSFFEQKFYFGSSTITPQIITNWGTSSLISSKVYISIEEKASKLITISIADANKNDIGGCTYQNPMTGASRSLVFGAQFAEASTWYSANSYKFIPQQYDVNLF